jgi:hypothetical protein
VNQPSTMTTRTRRRRIREDGTPEWKVHLPLLVQETLSNPHMGALKIPYQILQTLLIELANRTMRIGDIPVDDMMIRLAIYAQGDPHDRDHAHGTAVSINEARVRETHAAQPPGRVDQAIVLAHVEEAPDAALIGAACAAAWSGMTFASRAAVDRDGLSREAGKTGATA